MHDHGAAALTPFGARDEVPGVDDAGDPAERAEQDVDEQVGAAGAGEDDGQGWEEDGEEVQEDGAAAGGGVAGHCRLGGGVGWK